MKKARKETLEEWRKRVDARLNLLELDRKMQGATPLYYQPSYPAPHIPPEHKETIWAYGTFGTCSGRKHDKGVRD